MSGPSTSSERSTVNSGGQHLQQDHTGATSVRTEYDVTATAAAAVSASGYGVSLDDAASQFHQHQHNNYAAGAAAAAAEIQHRHELQRRQQQLQQQELHQQQQELHQQQLQQQHYQQLQQQQQQHHHQQQQHHHQLQQQQHHHQLQHHQQVAQVGAGHAQVVGVGGVQPPNQHQLHQHSSLGPSGADDYDQGILTSKYIENEIIKTFSSKQDLVKYVKYQLSNEEQCKIVINSSKPKAVYFQCERSGSFRTTVKDATKRQRVAYTKRNKCGYRLVANLYPPEKDKKKMIKKEGLDRNLDDKLADYPNSLGHGGLQEASEMWILRMINPVHNHAPEPSNGKKKRSKSSRTLVEKPLNKGNGYPQEVMQLQHHNGLQHHHIPQHLHDHQHPASVQDTAVIAAIEATPAAAAVTALHAQNPPVDPNIDPNVDPSVQAHDHSHGIRGNVQLHNLRR
ncbi:hypothetical protein G9P44_003079 [Scheffersomyces stipitis]|nr:hypothetical protein G9P44_003079 [Scheffersomyces stipitis]